MRFNLIHFLKTRPCNIAPVPVLAFVEIKSFVDIFIVDMLPETGFSAGGSAVDHVVVADALLEVKIAQLPGKGGGLVGVECHLVEGLPCWRPPRDGLFKTRSLAAEVLVVVLLPLHVPLSRGIAVVLAALGGRGGGVAVPGVS